jgi:hypothetical protein
MKTVLKYPLTTPIGEHFSIKLPAGATVALLAQQQGQLTIWFACDTEAPTSQRWFVVKGTGSRVRSTFQHLASALCENESTSVWHLYETFSASAPTEN